LAEWFQQWFGETYLDLYPHRDERDAAAVVRLISETVSLRGKRILDLACGPGRHSAILRGYETQTIGMDLSAQLLKRARGDYSPPITVVRGDMRALPFSAASFELVVNLFTSFGYFDSDDQHLLVLHDVARILKRNGWFVLDFFNAERVRETLVAYEELVLGGREVKVRRRISDDGKYVLKDMELIDEGRSFLEKVRLFGPDELEQLIANAGFAVREKYGNYEGEALDANSERALFFTVCL